MKRINDLREVQLIELDILVEFDKFCKKNDLKYSLYAGSLIGAVRHKGFIPWDDDIDLAMLREDYERFISIVTTKPFINENLEVCIPQQTKNYIQPFLKIVDNRTYVIESKKYSRKYDKGIYIDIFPFDYGFEQYEKCKEIIDRQQYYAKRLVRSSGVMQKSPFKTLCKILYNSFQFLIGRGTKYWSKKCASIDRLPPSKYIGNLIWPSSYGNILNTEYTNNYIELEFEDKKFKAFRDYDLILKSMYGDYMKIPNENERENHITEAYWL